LRENHLPTFLAELGGYEVIKFGNVIEYLELAQSKDAAWTVHELFPDHYWQQDFVEVPIAHDTWQPKIDVLQAQIDDLDSTYATDAQVVASFADQIAAAGDVFNLVDTKVGEEKTRAEAAELTLTQAVASEASTARANEVAIEDFFEGTNAQMDSDRDQIKLDFASGDATNAASVVTEKNRALAAEGINTGLVAAEASTARAAESVLTSAVSTEASTARANEAAIEAFFEGTDASALSDRNQIKLDFASADAINAVAVVTQKNRIDASESFRRRFEHIQGNRGCV
jgi:hypothetical protein